MTGRRIVTGTAFSAVYLVVTLVSYRHGLQPVRPFYNSIAPPPPYQWVKPPPDLARDNKPLSATKTYPFQGTKSQGNALNTSDLQASLVWGPGAFATPPAQTGVKVSITPLDPALLAPAPSGQSFDGNAYKFDATYVPSGKSAVLTATPPCPSPTSAEQTNCVDIVLRYAFGANQIYQQSETGWVELPKASAASSALQIFDYAPTLGTFVAVAPGITGSGRKPKGGFPGYLAFVLGASALILGTLAARERAVRARKVRARKGKKRQ